MSSGQEGAYSARRNINFADTNLTSSGFKRYTLAGRDILKYSYNLGVLAPEIEEMSTERSDYFCEKGNCKALGHTKTGNRKIAPFKEQISNCSQDSSKLKKLNSFGMTSLLRKCSVSPIVWQMEGFSSPLRESKQEIVEIDYVSNVSEVSQLESCDTKAELRHSQTETRADTVSVIDTESSSDLFLPACKYTKINSDDINKDENGAKEEEKLSEQPLSPTAKFRRAARRLGVLIPPQELYNKQRRNGVCEAMDKDADQRKLLRILNKRF